MTALVILTGCSRFSRGPALDIDTATVSQVREVLYRNARNLQSFYGQGQVSIESPRQTFTGAITTQMLPPDSVHVKLEAMLGIDVGILFADQQDFILYSPLDKLCYVGSSRDSLRLQSFIGFNMEFQQLLQALSGTAVIPDLNDAKLSATETELIVTGWKEAFTYEFLIDPTLGVVTRVKITDIWDRVVRVEEYKRHQIINKIRVPQLIRISRPEQLESLTVFYKNIMINHDLEPKSFYIKLPDDILKLEL